MTPLFSDKREKHQLTNHHYSVWLDFPICIINNDNLLSRIAFATFEVAHTFTQNG